MFIGHKLASPLLNAVVVPHGSHSHLLAASGGCWCTRESRVLHLPSPSHHTCTSCTFPPSVFCHGIWGVYQINTARWTSHSHWEPTAPHDKQRRWGGVYNRPLYTTFSPLSAPRHDWVARPAKAQPWPQKTLNPKDDLKTSLCTILLQPRDNQCKRWKKRDCQALSPSHKVLLCPTVSLQLRSPWPGLHRLPTC